MSRRNRILYPLRTALRRGYAATRRCLTRCGLPRFRIVRSVERLVRATLRTDVVDVLGHRMRLDVNDRAELSINGIYEPLTTDVVCAEIAEGPWSSTLAPISDTTR
jgi:hypothetical protein